METVIDAKLNTPEEKADIIAKITDAILNDREFFFMDYSAEGGIVMCEIHNESALAMMQYRANRTFQCLSDALNRSPKETN